MKKILFLIISASAIVLAGADFSLSNNKSGKFKFDAPSGKNAVLFFRARIKLPAPYEAWGANVLQVKLNGKALTSPINKDKNLVDSEVRPQISYPVCANGKLFVKADSDWEVFNAPNGEIYRNTWLLNQANKTELSNVFYSFAFKLDKLKKTGNTIDFKVILPKELARYKVEISDVQIRGFNEQITFARSFMQAVYPWSFPALKELDIPEVVMAKNEHGFATFSIYCFAPQKFKVPSGVQCYRLDNSNIPAKLKEAETRHIPNIGKPYVPELLTPLLSGSEVELPAGTTTFAVRFKSAETGKHSIAGQPFKFNVMDITLPEATELPVQNTMYIMAGGTDTQNIHPEFREYGISTMLTSPWAAPIPLKIVDDKLVADFRKFDARLKMFHGYDMNKKVLFFGTSEPIFRNITKLTGQEEEGKEFQRRFKEFIELFFNHADELGITVHLSLYDEANFQKKVWGRTKLLTSIAVTVPNSRMWSTVTELSSAAHYFETLGYRKNRDVCITHPFQVYDKADNDIIKGVLCPDKKISELRNRFFGEYEGITSYPATNNRYAYGVRSALGNIKYMMGFAFWWGNMRKPNITPTKRYYVSYPFREAKTGVRYSSVGWEAIRTGIDDIRYITMARELLSKKAGKVSAEKQIRTILGTPRYSAAPLSPEYLDNVRKAITKIILENK
ncbi:MAG: hypothetical protein E7054_03265 [Lentisphaerae bacterium]|nr:hypothetical protein [Lentisphaerota bacterium]